MRTSTLEKVCRAEAERGAMGQMYLARGSSLSMRMWDNVSAEEHCESAAREYETVGYVIDGQAELTVDGQTIRLLPGDSWVVPKDTPHSYKIISSFTAVEATTPPARAADRDKPTSSDL